MDKLIKKFKVTRGMKHNLCDDSAGQVRICFSGIVNGKHPFNLYVMVVLQVHYFNLLGEQKETWPPDLGRRGRDEFINITALGVDCADNLVVAEYR